MSNPPPLEPGKFYHIYNRGNNRENLFREERNYRYFLQLYARHIEPVAETFAYCLLPNHFHLLVKIRETLTGLADLSGLSPKPSQAFSNLFNAYTKTINKAYGRSGALFKRPFQRIEVAEAAYFARLVVYIHRNPQTHGLASDFRDWAYSSYHAHLAAAPTRLQRKAVLRWFDDAENFAAAHTQTLEETLLRNLIVEFE